MSFEVKSEQFNGPLHKLLELIEGKELEITTINLADVTADFIAHVEGLEREADSIIISEFVVVASRLLLIKSRVLLPNLELSQEEEADIADLERRLKIYRQLCAMNLGSESGRSGAGYINELWNRDKTSYGRKFLADRKEKSIFFPPKNIKAKDLEVAMRRITNILESILPEKETVQESIITLQEKIAELADKLSNSKNLSFNGSFKEEDKAEIVVLFLAVLHMLTNRLAEVEQEEKFGEINLTIINN